MTSGRAVYISKTCTSNHALFWLHVLMVLTLQLSHIQKLLVNVEMYWVLMLGIVRHFFYIYLNHVIFKLLSRLKIKRWITLTSKDKKNQQPSEWKMVESEPERNNCSIQVYPHYLHRLHTTLSIVHPGTPTSQHASHHHIQERIQLHKSPKIKKKNTITQIREKKREKENNRT